jgi:vacuolar-type H+-ATPase subunit E/Vma4
MALADLIASLQAEAAEQREAVAAQAREHARRIRAETEAEVERRRTESHERAEREARDEARRSVSRAGIAASSRVLASRARLLDRVRRAVVSRIEGAAGDPAYLDTLPHEVASALARMPIGAVEARVPEDLAKTLEAAIAGKGAVRLVPTSDGPMGYVLRSSDGGVEIDATLQARLELRWPHIAVRLMQEVDR